jgi:deoxyribonuclease-4
VVDECAAIVGLERLKCLHVNDSKVPLGANRDRHANLPEGELGRGGLATFLSEPRFEQLPALIETPGADGRGPGLDQVRIAKELREEGLAARGRSGAAAKGGRGGRKRPHASRAARKSSG